MTTQAAGVVLIVSSTIPRGTYLTYASDGSGSFAGGDAVPRRKSKWVLPLSPGTVTLACSAGGRADSVHTAHVNVGDPGGFWRGDSLAVAGCDPSGGQPSWVIGSSGTAPTARDAVQRTVHSFDRLAKSQGTAPTYTARPAHIGYPAAATQTWIVSKDGHAAFTLEVTHTGNAFKASPDALCGT